MHKNTILIILLYLFTEILSRKVVILCHIHLHHDIIPSLEALFITCIRMGDSGSSRHSFKMDDEYDLTFQLLYPLRLAKKYTCIWTIIEVLSYRFEPTHLVQSDIASSLPTAYLFA